MRCKDIKQHTKKTSKDLRDEIRKAIKQARILRVNGEDWK